MFSLTFEIFVDTGQQDENAREKKSFKTFICAISFCTYHVVSVAVYCFPISIFRKNKNKKSIKFVLKGFYNCSSSFYYYSVFHFIYITFIVYNNPFAFLNYSSCIIKLAFRLIKF